MTRSRRSSDPHGYTTLSGTARGLFNGILRRMADKLSDEGTVAKSTSKVGRHGNNPKKYSDEVILSIRRLREWGGWDRNRIAAFFDIPVGSVNAYLEYRLRTHLDPGPRRPDWTHADEQQAREHLHRLGAQASAFDEGAASREDEQPISSGGR